jgi:hypothetical protein
MAPHLFMMEESIQYFSICRGHTLITIYHSMAVKIELRPVFRRSLPTRLSVEGTDPLSGCSGIALST